jgi:predicted NUDIX family phosphoesterase
MISTITTSVLAGPSERHFHNEKGVGLEQGALQAAADAKSEALDTVSARDVEICMRVLDPTYENLIKTGLIVDGEPEVDTLIE